MKRLLLISVLAIPLTAHADKARSIMFGDPDPFYQQDNHEALEARQQKTEHEAHCLELSRETTALKGKPLRRSAASDRYQQECVGP